MLQTARSLRERIAAHYSLVSPLLERSFGGVPLVFASYPRGFAKGPKFHGPVWPLPNGLKCVGVRLGVGFRHYLALGSATIEHVVRDEGAVDVYSWTPVASDPLRARFGRILLERDTAGDDAALAPAALLLRDMLAEAGLQAIPILGGRGNLAIYIPVCDAPEYPALRKWLNALCVRAVLRWPRTFTAEPNSHACGRVHLHAHGNAPGLYSALPYSLRAHAELHVCTPVRWDELASLAASLVTAETLGARLAAAGDVFAAEAERIGDQRIDFASGGATAMADGRDIEPHGHILRAALEVLQDGRPRDAASILAEALSRKLVPSGTKEKYVYTSLLEYIVRTSGHGHRPAIVQDVDRRFRINEPPDAWPPLDGPGVASPSAATQAAIDRLVATAQGADPAAFELAVCDAFALLGFAVTHVGGNGHPDGYADAQLGVLGYRVMLECKTGSRTVHNPDVFEASKYRDAYGAQFCALIGPAYAEEIELASELQTHEVSAWTVEDLQRLLRLRGNPYEMRALFAPGFASDRLDDVLWERLHGAEKRVRLICEYLCEAGWAAQVAAAKQGSPQNAPRLSEDAAMLLVDQHLAAEGSTASCSRDELRLAFEWLTNPRTGAAVWSDAATKDAVVIVQAGGIPAGVDVPSLGSVSRAPL